MTQSRWARRAAFTPLHPSHRSTRLNFSTAHHHARLSDLKVARLFGGSAAVSRRPAAARPPTVRFLFPQRASHFDTLRLVLRTQSRSNRIAPVLPSRRKAPEDWRTPRTLRALGHRRHSRQRLGLRRPSAALPGARLTERLQKICFPSRPVSGFMSASQFNQNYS